ncbi:MAG: diphthine synthase [Methanomassiliicoccales archaeon]|nr:diphthine synthase [Methanomassiliicoccales archaeon]
MSLRALQELKSCDRIFGEFYTSKLIDSDVKGLQELIGKEVQLMDRTAVEEGEDVIDAAKTMKVAFVTAGDTMAATTHVDIRLRAMEEGIQTRLIHGVSIFTACASSFGLQPYKFGRTITLPFQEKNFQPTSPYENILENKKRGLHSLVLLDIQDDIKRYMTAADGVRWLLDAEQRIGGGLITPSTIVCAAARVGSKSEKLVAGYPEKVLREDMGGPLHTLILPGKLHFMEATALVRMAGAPAELAEGD